jgi:hypothetical protein
LIAALDQVAYNWDDYFRARAETRPIAVVNTLATVAYVAVALPLLIADGLPGFEIGMAVSALTGVTGRIAYLSRLFPTLDMARHIVRAIVPTVPAAAAVLLIRAVSHSQGLGAAIAELLLYIALALGTTVVLERPLLRELRDYLVLRPAS